jgi:hypothetical protein
MPHATVCHRHRRLVLDGDACAECSATNSSRRARRNDELGRTSATWRRLSGHARHHAGGVCEACGCLEDVELDAGSKLTVDLIGGGDHRTARLQDVRVLCRRCHGAADGGRRR